MLQESTTIRTTYQPAPPPPSIIKSLYAKVGTELYQVELNYKVNGLFCLRPASRKPYKYLLLPAERVRELQLFPIFGV